MAAIMVMRTGHQYRIDPTLTPDAVNSALDAGGSHRFIQVPLDPAGAAVSPGTPGVDKQVLALFITPDSVSHFYVV